MKKILSLIVIMFAGILLTGCSTYNNEIYNRAYNVDINLDDLEQPVTKIVDEAGISVIGVSNYNAAGVIAGVGSGVIYKVNAVLESGIVVPYTDDLNNVKEYELFAITNRHVIEDNDTVYAYLGYDDIEVEADVLGFDDKVDIAIIKFIYSEYIPPLALSDSNLLKKGNFAIAIGNPSGYEFYGSATFGIISHPRRYMSDDTDGDKIADWDSEYIQHDVAINPGNSGGPLINMDGKIIGINTMKFVDTDIDNMGFSIPSSLVSQLIPYLEQGKTPPRAKLGIGFLQISGIRGLTLTQREELNIPDEINYGLYIQQVNNGSIASAAGLRSKDIILSFDGVDIKQSYDIRELLNNIGADPVTVEVEVFRNGERITKLLKFNY